MKTKSRVFEKRRKDGWQERRRQHEILKPAGGRRGGQDKKEKKEDAVADAFPPVVCMCVCVVQCGSKEIAFLAPDIDPLSSPPQNREDLLDLTLRPPHDAQAPDLASAAQALQPDGHLPCLGALYDEDVFLVLGVADRGAQEVVCAAWGCVVAALVVKAVVSKSVESIRE